MRIAVDVMGGDHAPDAILKGCAASLEDLGKDDRLILVGPRPLIQDYLTERGVRDERVEIEHAEEVIGMEESPALAVRSKKNSSIVKMALLGSEKAPATGPGARADVVLSAGNTGACVSAGIMHMKRLPKVHRPGIAVTVPAFKGPVVMIDCGANPEPKPAHLWQYAVMAVELARTIHGIENPRVAQMNIGSEEAKGTETIKQTRELLRATPGLNYVGYVEGRDLFDGNADVIVTDGFVGNTLLKMAEGLAKSIFSALATEILTQDPALMLQIEPVFKQIWKKNDYHEHGGAPLLGVNGAMFIAHGSSEAKTIRSAIRSCRRYVESGVNQSMARRLEEVAHVGAALAGAGTEG